MCLDSRLLCLAVAQSDRPNWTLVQGRQPSKLWYPRASHPFYLTENVAQLSREPNPRLEKMIKSKYYVITPACAKYSATLAISSRLIYYPPICTTFFVAGATWILLQLWTSHDIYNSSKIYVLPSVILDLSCYYLYVSCRSESSNYKLGRNRRTALNH